MKIRILAAVLACLAVPVQARERNWIPAEIASIKETRVDTEDLSYKSSQPNNTMNGPLRPAGVEKSTRKFYTYVFKAGDKQYSGRAEKRSVQGLAEGMKVKIAVHRGWLLIQMPDGKEKRIDFVE
jgi:hypothetical protein